MNLCLRFVTSTVMGLDLAAILLAAILALPAAYADEDPIDEEGGDEGGTIGLVPECTRNCDCVTLPNENGEPCNSFGPGYCLTQCFCVGSIPTRLECHNQ
jgi:hypothetical protein